MRKVITIFAMFLCMTELSAQTISHIETKGNWYYIYDSNGRKTKTLSNTSGTLLRYSSTIFIMRNGSWYYIYDANARKIKTMSKSATGDIIAVAGDTFTSRIGSWIYTWDKTVKRIHTRFCR